MQQTMSILREAYESDLPNEQLEKKLKRIKKEELIDSLLWQFNRGHLIF